MSPSQVHAVYVRMGAEQGVRMRMLISLLPLLSLNSKSLYKEGLAKGMS